MAEGRRIIKKVVAGHGHHGGAWKVAYADFVTAMMALFMVMWLLASTDQQQRKEISNYFRTGAMPNGELSGNGVAKGKPALFDTSVMPMAEIQEKEKEKEKESPKEATAEEIGEGLANAAAVDPALAGMMKNVRISVTQEGVLIEAVDEGNGMLFDVASTELKPTLTHFIETLAPMVAKTAKPVEINGHTDSRPFVPGSHMSNWDLSYQRASAAREVLVAHGVSDQQVTGVFARGASQLYVANDPLSAQNRRLSFLIKIPPAEKKPTATEN